MKISNMLVISTTLLLLNPALAGPCDSEQHRAFDFWLGDWQVYKTDGSIAGKNRINLTHNGCVLTEQYSTAGSYSGQSLNIYDASRDVWHQSWVDNSGALLLLEGNVIDGSMLMTGKGQSPDGKQLWHQIRWTPNSDGSVRQHWQSKTTAGDWQTVFDGLYRKIEPPQPH